MTSSTKKVRQEQDDKDDGSVALNAHGNASLKEDLGNEPSRIASRTSQKIASGTHDKVSIPIDSCPGIFVFLTVYDAFFYYCGSIRK
jgi:hypothetical protein